MQEAEILAYLLKRKKRLEDSKETLTSGRFYSDKRPRIKELESIIRDLQSGVLCEHDLQPVRDSRYPYKPIRCVKCGYEP